jgi:hypothetical protein
VNHLAEELLQLFAERLRQRSGYTDVDIQPALGIVTLTYLDQGVVLNFTELALMEHLDAETRYGPALGGPRITAMEAAARLMSVHLDESLETREPHPSGQWTYHDGGFSPIPPWEAHH